MEVLGWFPPTVATFEASWESACQQILCFCGGMECRNQPRARIMIELGIPIEMASIVTIELAIFQFVLVVLVM